MQQAAALCFGGQRALVLTVASAASCRLQIHFIFSSYRFLCRLDSSLPSYRVHLCTSVFLWRDKWNRNYVLTKRWQTTTWRQIIMTHALVLRMDIWGFDSFVFFFCLSRHLIVVIPEERPSFQTRPRRTKRRKDAMRCNWISLLKGKKMAFSFLFSSLFIFTPGKTTVCHFIPGHALLHLD